MSDAKQRQSIIEQKRQQGKKRRNRLAFLGVMVVLVTAWALMVPAISITQDAATQERGFYQENQQSTEAVEAANAGADDASGGGDASAAVAQDASDSSVSAGETAGTDDVEASSGDLDEAAAADEAAASGAAADVADDAAKSDKSSEASSASDMPAQKLKTKVADANGATVMTVEIEAPEGALPKGATVVAERVADERVLDAAKQKGAEQGAVDAERAKAVAVDITFKNAEGEEIEPAKDVRVTMGASAVQEAVRESGSDGAIAVVHLDDKRLAEMAGVEKVADIDESHAVEVEDAKSVADVVDNNKVAVDRSQKKVAFEAAEFSVYAIVYTVDFEYEADGQVYQYSLPGGKAIALSDLIEVLGITGDKDFSTVDELIAEVENVEFSDPRLVTVVRPEEDTTVGEILRDLGVERQISAAIGEEEALALENEPVRGNEWTLISIKAFDTDESLTITLKSGDVLTVKVTDASSVASNDGIKSLLTDVSITGARQEGGAYVVYPDQPYGIHLTFKEVNKENGQFPMGDSFTYQLPAGLVPSGSSVSNFLEITLSGGDHAGETVKLNYTISDSGLITFNWDKTTNPGAYSQLADALYSQFRLDIDCTYTGDGGTLDFGNNITKEVTVKNNGTVNVNKTGKYNAATNCVDYTVSVYSDGITKDVVITDTVSGSALTYNRDAASSSSVYGKEVPSPTSNSNGFSLTIPQMADQETVTVRYSAAVNLDALTQNSDGSWGTVTQTGNKVVVNSKNNPPVEKENSGKDFENKISMSSIGKSGSPVEADETGHATVNWTIHANDNANVSMAGHTISDSISGNSVPMSYNSSGIHVVAYKADGTQAYEKDIAWGSNGLTKTADNQAWNWVVPNQDPDTQKLSYVITYTTDVDVTGRLINTEVKNHSESDNGGSSDGSSSITPNGGALTARKKVVKTDITSKTVTWEINFDVPATGLDSAQIIDTMPTFWENGQVKYFDGYLGNSTITITPELAAGESYEATTSADGRTLTIDFYKTEEEQKVSGLSATGSARKIRVQFQTEFNDEWLTEAEGHQNEANYTNHTNTGRVLLNGQTIGVNATTKVENNEPGMSKVHGAQTTYNVNGNSLPAFPYIVTLEGVTDDYFDDSGMLYVEDTFNGKYLAYYPQTQNNNTGDNDLVGYLYGATNYQDLSKGGDPIHNVAGKSSQKVVSSPSDGKILISISRDDIPLDDSGNYYPYYYIFYYLTVKDPIALEKLNTAIQQSDSGVYSLLNTVSNQKFGSTTDTAEFEIPVLDKTITSPNGKAYYNNGNWMVDFKLDVNPDALDLGDEEELTLTDDYTNLAVDYTTIKIQKEDNGSLVDTTDADGVSWNRKGNRVTYTLQNGVHYVITYKARITGEPGNDGKVHYDNTAEYFGVKKWTKGDQNISSSGSGSAPTYGMTVFKHEKGAGSSPLSGAKFDLYRITEQGEEDSWQVQPSNAINVSTRKPEDTKWEYVNTLTTDSAGVAKTGSVSKWTWYMLVETEAPVYEGSEHYKLKDYGYVFWITDKGAADYSHYVYLNDDVVAIDNEPPVPETVDIGVTKTWTNDNGDISKRKDITVRLFADGVPYADWTDKNGNHLEPRDDTVKVLPIKANGTTDGYTWTDLPGGPVYSVVEDGVAGYTTTYSPKSSQVSGTINIRNKYIPGKTFIHVEKAWSSDIAPENRAEDITVQLKRKVSANAEIRVVSNTGTMREHFSVPVGSTVSIDFAGKAASENSGGTRPAWELYKGNIEITNGTVTGELIGSDAGTSYTTEDHGHEVHINNITVNADGLTLRLPADYGQGQYDPNLYLSQTPQVTVAGGVNAEYSEDVNFNNENHYYTISAANGWKIDIDRLVKEDDDGKYIYYVEEVGVNDNTETPEEAGYTVTYENNAGIEGGTGNANLDTVKVTNSPEPGSLEVKKTVSGTDVKGEYRIAVKGSNGHYYGLGGEDKGTNPFYVAFSKNETKKWNNLPAGTYTVEEQDANVTGYTWHVTGVGNVEVPVGNTADVEVINAYEKLPETGSLKIVKMAKIGETVASELTDSRQSLADGTYTFNVYTDSSATVLATKADGSPVGDVTVEIRNGAAVNAAEVEGLAGGTYYVKETSGTNSAVTLDTTIYEVTVEPGKTGDAVESTAVATATNTLPLGSLEVTKKVFDTSTNQEISGSYEYPIDITVELNGRTYHVQNGTGALGTEVPNPSLAVSTTNALSINNLPYGTYKVAEAQPGSIEISRYSYVIIEESVAEASVAVGEESGSVELKNYYTPGAAWTPEVQKLLNGEAYAGSGYSFKLRETTQGRVGDIETKTTDAATGKATFETIQYHVNDLQGLKKEFTYEITEVLPTEAEGSPHIADNVMYDAKTIYAVVTVEKNNGGGKQKLDATAVYYSDAAHEHRLDTDPVFNNTELGKLVVQKTVEGSYSATSTDEFPFTIMKDGKYVTATVSGNTYAYSGLSETNPGYKIKAGAVNKITFENLPVGTYVVTEGNADRTGFNVTTTYKVNGSNAEDGTSAIQKGAETSVEITNSYSNVTLDVVKVEKNDCNKTLSGAKFRITLLDDAQTTAGRVVTKTSNGSPVYQVESSATGNDGKVSFAGLTDGYYMIEETKTPDGYVISAVDPTFYIHVEGESITYLVRSADAAHADDLLSSWSSSNTGSGLVIYDKAAKKATVENTPGTTLPHTGGPGTHAFAIIGGILCIAAGAFLARRLRTSL